MDSRTVGERVADNVAQFVGSWWFIWIQSCLIFLWIFLNVAHFLFSFDPFPFVFLNLFMSAEAAFSTPIIMMSQNRASDRDRHQADADYQTNVAAKEDIELLMVNLSRIESEKLDTILALLVEPTMKARKLRVNGKKRPG